MLNTEDPLWIICNFNSSKLFSKEKWKIHNLIVNLNIFLLFFDLILSLWNWTRIFRTALCEQSAKPWHCHRYSSMERELEGRTTSRHGWHRLRTRRRKSVWEAMWPGDRVGLYCHKSQYIRKHIVGLKPHPNASMLAGQAWALGNLGEGSWVWIFRTRH